MRTPGLQRLLLALPLALGSMHIKASAVPASAGGNELSAAPSIGAPVDANADSVRACGHSPQARQLVELIRNHPLQRRPRLSCHPVLAAAAADKAEEMAARGQVSHIYGVMAPNRRLRQAGYRLPLSYPGMFHNQVEAVSGGFSTAAEALQAFLDSRPHRTHLLAEHPFYAEQDEIAVGYARNPDSEHIDYWVVFIARRIDSGNPPTLLQAEASAMPATK
jgi:uncharacterized protein YkwD